MDREIADKPNAEATTGSQTSKAVAAVVLIALVPVVGYALFTYGSVCEGWKKDYEDSLRRGRPNNLLLRIARRKECSWAKRLSEPEWTTYGR